jgi:hypothetical protein
MGGALGTFLSDMFNAILRLGWWSPRPGHGAIDLWRVTRPGMVVRSSGRLEFSRIPGRRMLAEAHTPEGRGGRGELAAPGPERPQGPEASHA